MRARSSPCRTSSLAAEAVGGAHSVLRRARAAGARGTPLAHMRLARMPGQGCVGGSDSMVQGQGAAARRARHKSVHSAAGAACMRPAAAFNVLCGVPCLEKELIDTAHGASSQGMLLI